MTLPAPLMSCDKQPTASDSALRKVEEQLERPLPPDYKEILRQSDGLEGFVGEDNYLSLWSSSDLPSLNEAYCVSEFVPGLTLLGTDGADLGYGFRITDGTFEYVSVPLVGMRPTEVSALGRSFGEFLEHLSRPE